MTVHARSTRPHRRTAVAAAATAAALVALLTGCGPSGPQPLPVDLVTFPAETAAVATPGQELAEGDVVTLPDATNGGKVRSIEATVVGSAAGDEAFWDTYDNGSGFAGEVPYFVVVQYRWVTGEASNQNAPLLRPVLDDGSEGSIVQLDALIMNTDDACPFEVPTADDPRELVECVVMTAPEGRTLTGVSWDSTTEYTIYAPDPAEAPFFAAPVTWSTTPLQPRD